MNDDFIRRASNFKVFNFKESDFTSTTYKDEIRHLFNLYYFPDLTLEETTTSKVDKVSINKIINALKSYSKENYIHLYDYPIGGTGSGEVALFYIINNSYLGGQKSAAADLFIGSSKYEIKSTKISKQNEAYGFMTGGTFSVDDIKSQLDNLRSKLKLAGSKQSINKSVLYRMRELAPERFNVIEREYAELAYDKYFKAHKTIFFNNNDTALKGQVEAIMQVKAQDIKIDELTSNVIKPRVKL